MNPKDFRELIKSCKKYHFILKQILINYMLTALAKNNDDKVKTQADYEHRAIFLLLSIFRKTEIAIKVKPKYWSPKNFNFLKYLHSLSNTQITKLSIDYGLLDKEIEERIKQLDKKINSSNFLKSAFNDSINPNDNSNGKQPLLLKDNQLNKILKSSIFYCQKRILAEFFIIKANAMGSISSERVDNILDEIYKKFIENLQRYPQNNNNLENDKKVFFKKNLTLIFEKTFSINLKSSTEINIKRITEMFYKNKTKKLLANFRKTLLDTNVSRTDKRISTRHSIILGITAISNLGAFITLITGIVKSNTLLFGISLFSSLLLTPTLILIIYYVTPYNRRNMLGRIKFISENLFKDIIISTNALLLPSENINKILASIENSYIALIKHRDISKEDYDSLLYQTQEIANLVNSINVNEFEEKLIDKINNSNFKVFNDSDIMNQSNVVSLFGRMSASINNNKKEEPLLPAEDDDKDDKGKGELYEFN